MQYFLRVVCVISTLVIAACGGGGGGGGDSGNGYSISVNPGSVAISTYEDTAAPTKRVTATFVGDGVIVGVPPGSSQPDWLTITAVSSGNGTAEFDIFADETKVPIGTRSATLRFVTGKADGSSVKSVDVLVTFTVLDAFSLSKASIDLITTYDGAIDGPQEVVHISGAQSRWQIGALPNWLSVSGSAGVGEADIEFSCNKTALDAAGVFFADVEIVDSAGGRALRLPVRCLAQPHKILSSRYGVAFSQFSNVGSTSADILITQNGSTVIGWTASTSAAWLQVDESGLTGEQLHLSANPAELSPGFHQGEVTITSNASTISQSETIRVGFYVSNDSLPDQVHVGIVPSISDIRDPIRPIVYTRSGNEIHGVNVYTGIIEKKYSLPQHYFSFDVSDVSDDGMYLYVVDATAESSTYSPSNVYRFNLDDEHAAPTLLFTESGPLSGHEYGPISVKYFRNAGIPLLFNPLGRLHLADSGVVVANFKLYWNGFSDNWWPVFLRTKVSVHRTGSHIAITKSSPQGGDHIDIYRVTAFDLEGVETSVSLESQVNYQYPEFYEPGSMLLGDELDRVYVRFGYAEKSGAGWTYNGKFFSDTALVYSNDSSLFGSGSTGPGGSLVIGEYDKNGTLMRSLSEHAPYGWYKPWVSSDDLVVFASTRDLTSNVILHGFRR